MLLMLLMLVRAMILGLHVMMVKLGRLLIIAIRVLVGSLTMWGRGLRGIVIGH